MHPLALQRPTVAPAVAGLGVDVCPPERLAHARERWGPRARAVFSPHELEAFPGGELAVPWAAREAAIKAIGLPSVLGAPLGDLRVVRAPSGQVTFALGPAALAALAERGLAGLSLATTRVAGAVLAVAVAHAPTAPTRLVAWGALPSRGDASASARTAALLALRPLLPAPRLASPAWSGGADRAPRLTLGGGPQVLVSLSHDGGLSAAAVAAPAAPGGAR